MTVVGNEVIRIVVLLDKVRRDRSRIRGSLYGSADTRNRRRVYDDIRVVRYVDFRIADAYAYVVERDGRSRDRVSETVLEDEIVIGGSHK